jgi:addiction module RelE/StbE family toxin
MLGLVYSRNFLKSAKKLPKNIQVKLAQLLPLLQDDPYHSQLHTKHLTGDLLGFLSFRITRDWRVIFKFIDEETIQLLRVAHRKDIYR